MLMPRYYVRESTGFLIPRPGAEQGGGSRQITEVLVLDRDYCHRVAWSSLSRVKRYYAPHLPALRLEAKRLCLEWNAEDRADAA